jgi:hypothetical protein
MGEVRERVERKRAAGLYDDETLDLLHVPLDVESPAERLAASALVVGHREAMSAKTGLLGVPLELLRRAVVKLAGPFLADLVAQVNTFHVETVNELRRLGDRVTSLDATTRRLGARIDALERDVADARRRDAR